MSSTAKVRRSELKLSSVKQPYLKYVYIALDPASFLPNVELFAYFAIEIIALMTLSDC